MWAEVADTQYLLKCAIIGDEIWVYGFYIETKAQLPQWNLLKSQARPKKSTPSGIECEGSFLLLSFITIPQFTTNSYYQVVLSVKSVTLKSFVNFIRQSEKITRTVAHTSLLLIHTFLAINNTVVNGTATLFTTYGDEWYTCFEEGREDTEDDKKIGRPTTSTP